MYMQSQIAHTYLYRYRLRQIEKKMLMWFLLWIVLMHTEG